MLDAKERQVGAVGATVVEGVRKVAAKAKERAVEIDTKRAFPSELFDEMEATGAFRLMTPREYGGLGLGMDVMVEAVHEAARGNGSLGWLAMVGTSQSVGNGLYSEATVRKIVDQFPDVRIRGVIAPKGQAIPIEGGYRVSGQWPFASGGPDPHFVGGNCIVMEDGRPKLTADGEVELIMALASAEQAEFLDNWRVLGMRGTDSCDVVLKDVFVPLDLTFNLHELHCIYDMPAGRLPLRVVLSFPHCSVATGLAEGAIDDIVALAKTKRASMNPNLVLGDDVLFRHELGKAVVRLEGVKAMTRQLAADCWQAGEDRRDLTPKEVLTARLAANFITDECKAIVDWAYTVSGSSSVYDGSSLQRRLRDIHIATQHASCHPDPYRNLGAVMMGAELSPRELF